MNLPFHMSPPSNILKRDFLDEYEKDVESIWWQLVWFNTRMFILEKIYYFRFDLFDSHFPNSIFWEATSNSLFESCILSIWRILIDGNSDKGLTIHQLKNKIRKNLVNEDIETEFRKRVKELKFNKSVLNTIEKIKAIRTEAIAHFNRKKDVTSKTEDKLPIIDLQELKDVKKNILDNYYFLRFGAIKEPNTLQYLIGNEKDIDEILDNIAKESVYVKGDEYMPPEIWKEKISELSPDDKKEVNKYRVKFGKGKIK